MLIGQDGVDDGVEDELAASACDEPVVGQGDAQVWLLGGWVYHLVRGMGMDLERVLWRIKRR